MQPWKRSTHGEPMGRIADTIRAVLNGEQPLSALGPSALMDVAMPIYEEACRILKLSKLVWVEEVEQHPPEIQELVKAEIKRLYAQRLAMLPPRNRSKARIDNAMAQLAEKENHKPGWIGWQK